MVHIGKQGVDQAVMGPIQDDEALLLFALVQASHVRRVLEIGGRLGDSAYNFVQGLHRKNGSRVYSVDTARVPRVYGTTANHTPIQKDARALVLADVDNEPIDLLFLDCHDFLATRASLTRLLDK